MLQWYFFIYLYNDIYIYKRNTYGHSFSKSDFFDRNDKPENSENSDSGRVHSTNSLKSQASIFT